MRQLDHASLTELPRVDDLRELRVLEKRKRACLISARQNITSRIRIDGVQWYKTRAQAEGFEVHALACR